MNRSDILMDNRFLVQVRKNWKNMPRLFKIRLAETLHRNIGSIRNTAKLLGLKKSTVFYYLKSYRHSNFTFSFREQTSVLREFLTKMNYPDADPDFHSGTSDHLFLIGDEANTVLGDLNE